jgi:hypothetical protein
VTFFKKKFDKNLDASYKLVGNKIYKYDNLSINSIKNSISLFTKKSLALRKPEPINVNVYGLVSGLPFSKNTVKSIYNIISSIRDILKNKNCYWVKPNNLAVEYCVFKWPMDPWNLEWSNKIIYFLRSSNYYAFDLFIHGIQLHTDGCIVAKGYDGGALRKIRSNIVSNLSFVPKKQSRWAHIPIGRILEPISGRLFSQLKELIYHFSNIKIGVERLTEASFVHEKKWYMEKKTILYRKKFL